MVEKPVKESNIGSTAPQSSKQAGTVMFANKTTGPLILHHKSRVGFLLSHTGGSVNIPSGGSVAVDSELAAILLKSTANQRLVDTGCLLIDKKIGDSALKDGTSSPEGNIPEHLKQPAEQGGSQGQIKEVKVGAGDLPAE